MGKKKTREEFIKDARDAHGDKYDYSKVEYVNNRTKVCIKCPEHGEFWQKPNDHLNGKGCPKCGIEKMRESISSSKEEFIKKAKEAHKNKYDYSKVKYVNSRTKVCIICPQHDHGEFLQAPADHTNGQGCPKCGVENRSGKKTSTKEEFIKKACEKHGDKYDYSNVQYVNNKTKVCIICPQHDHGEFWQTPNSHLRGQGCPKCGQITRGGSNRLSKSEFIKKVCDKHNDKYDYSKVDYVNSKTKVCIICPKHGEFWQQANSHLRGAGCPKCKGDKNCERQTLTKEEFIKKANEKHNDKYDYSRVNYEKSNIKVCIICPEHDEFWQAPANHLYGQGCPKCGVEKVRKILSSSKEDFIKKANETHKGKYDYSQVKYVNCDTKVCIICHEHGEFKQTPDNHLQGHGCPKCNLSHLERSVMNYLDDMGITYDYQKRFNWLGKQSLDFYLPDYNVGIECQGGQHFFPVERFGGDKTFKQTLQRDKRKKALCEKHGVKLLYFGNIPNYDTFLGEVVHDDVQYLIDYLNEHKKENKLCQICSS